MTSNESALPRGWIEGPLASFVTPRREKALPSAMPRAVFLGMDHVEAHTTRIIGSADASEMKSTAVCFRKGDVLYGRLRPYLNKVATPSFDGLASAEFIVFPDAELVRSQFLKYRLSAGDFVNFATHLKEGDRPRVTFDQIGSFQLHLPPAREQLRIVAKVEELFSEVDKGIEALTNAREQLELYRLVVLHEAVCTKDGALYPFKALQELIGPIGQGWSPKCELNRPPQEGEWAIMKTTTVQPMSYLPQECKPLPAELEPRLGIEVRDGDLLMTRKGPRSRTGVVCYVEKARPHSMLCDTVYRFRAVELSVLPKYLEIALNAPSVRQEIDARKSGISESGISLNHGRIRSLPVPVPADRATQARIVQTVRERLSLIENVAAIVKEQETRVKALRQAILEQAFSGQLVAQNPKDEPASALLERIRAERESVTMKKERATKNGGKKAA